MTARLAIAGAGLAGLVAAHAWPQANVLEAAPAPREGHRALLRFRSDAVARLTGIEFRRVRVRKGLWAEERFQGANIRWANLYARKVVGALRGDRSVWSLEPVDRYVAPDTFYEQLVDAVGARIAWSTPADFAAMRTPTVSTAPLPVVLGQCGIECAVPFRRAPIHVTRYTLPGADAFQTVYFPEPELGVYRASITGHTLICESMTPELEDVDLDAIERAFGLEQGCLGGDAETVEQKFGKIVPIDDPVRKHLLFRLTHEYNIFSLGRFATWRNLLLDDVVDDIAVLKRLMRASTTNYDLQKALAS
jgi:hypothetical protein